VQLRYQARLLFSISHTCFWPPPDVQSACVRMDRREVEPLPPALAPVYVRLVKIAFSQRRKMMRKLLKAGWPETAIDRAYETAGLDRDVRAERVGREQFIAMTQVLAEGRKPAA